MAQILDPLPPESSGYLLCCYVNATSRIQIARISNIPNWYYERVVFPGQRLIFEAPPEAQLEIHTGMMASAILSDKIPCYRLCVDENGEQPDPVEPVVGGTKSNHSGENFEPKSRHKEKPLTIPALTSVE